MFFREQNGRLKSVAWHLLGNQQDAEDAVQEAFLRAYRSRSSFRGDSSLGTWMYRILVNTCHSHARTRMRQVVPESELGIASTGEGGVMRLALQRAVNQLSEANRPVFLLHEVEGFSHAEIGEILEIPEGTSRARLYEAKKMLRKLLE